MSACLLRIVLAAFPVILCCRIRDCIGFLRPLSEIKQFAPLRTERAVAVIAIPDDGSLADGTMDYQFAHGNYRLQ